MKLEDVLASLRQVEAKFGRHRAVFRGHSNIKWDLVPHVFREPHVSRVYSEFSLSMEFMHAAPLRYPSCPEYGDWANWLTMMQHHGLPTRLLDWTRSILVATFFACWKSELSAVDGAVWAIDQFYINNKSLGQPGVIGLSEMGRKVNTKSMRRANYLLQDAFTDTPRSPEPFYCVVIPLGKEPRLVAQQGLFTIHNNGYPLNKQPDSASFSTMFLVAASHKSALLDELDSIGVSERSLFPDLEHLAHDIRSGPIMR